MTLSYCYYSFQYECRLEMLTSKDSLVVLILIRAITEAYSQEQPIVETKLGKYRGHIVTTLGGRKISAFNGIRYAKPHIANLRFKEAEKVEAHEGIFDATKDGEDCLQENLDLNKYLEEETKGIKYVGSEDCLYLNVYTPNVKPSKPYPVMIYIHGGAYSIGTSAINQKGPQLLLDKDIILVALNYRVNVFGFLAFDDEILPGNWGLKDQSLAIHWVKENIAAFGGDPELITVVGHSAGASSVHFQMISPRNKGYIQRGISQSGSGRCPWSTISRNKAKETTLELASILNCPTSPEQLLICLQEQPSENILNAIEVLKQSRTIVDITFGPVFEVKQTGFMSEKDFEAGSTLPWLAGVTSDEGLIVYRDLYNGGDRNLKLFNANYKILFPNLFNYTSHPSADKISNLIKSHYFGEDAMSDKKLKQFINLISDGLFIHCQLETARKHKGNTYLYLFSHIGQNSLASQVPLSGVCHADELFYFFPFSKSPRKLEFNNEDSKVQKLLVDLWTNFITYGDPTPGNEQPKWYESENGKIYVTITSQGINLSKNLYSTRMNFWDNLYSTYFTKDNIKDEL